MFGHKMMEEATTPKERLGPTLHERQPRECLGPTLHRGHPQEASRPHKKRLREMTSKKVDVQEGPTKCSLVLIVV